MPRIQVSTPEDTKIAEAVQAMVDYVNGYNPERLASIIAATLLCNHRTLQQSLIGAIKTAIETYSRVDPACYTDARNAVAHKWARQVAALCDSPAQILPGRLPVV